MQATNENYMVAGGRSLKEEGNTHYTAARYSEAIECYSLVLSNLEGLSSHASKK